MKRRLKTTRRERLKSALYEAHKAKGCKTCLGRFYEKLREQFQDTQRVPLMLDETGKPLFADWKQKNSDFFFRKMSHSAENPKESSILAKRFLSRKSRRGIDEKLEKSRIVPKNRRS